MPFFHLIHDLTRAFFVEAVRWGHPPSEISANLKSGGWVLNGDTHLLLDVRAHPAKMKPVNARWSARLDILAPALFWGSVWGLWEATAGHAVHLLRFPGLAGAVMLPAAVLFMSRAFAASGREETIFLAGCTAAGLKLLDLLIPGHDLLSILNPAQFILLEALAVAGAQAAALSFAGRRRTAPLNKRAPGFPPSENQR